MQLFKSLGFRQRLASAILHLGSLSSRQKIVRPAIVAATAQSLHLAEQAVRPALLLSFEEPGQYLCLRVPNAALCDAWHAALNLAMLGNARAVQQRQEACAALRGVLTSFLKGRRAAVERGFPRGGGGSSSSSASGDASAAKWDPEANAKTLAAFDREAAALVTVTC